MQCQYRLPQTKIETDSYAAVQLLERQKDLDEKSLKAVAEELDGSFTITVLGVENGLFFVKGNNPLTIRLFPGLGAYLYASTRKILDTVLDRLGLSGEPYADIPIRQGDILNIDCRGRRTLARFDDSRLLADWYSCGRPYGWGASGSAARDYEADAYLDEVVSYGLSQGVPEAELRLLLDAGYDAFDLEELLYDPEFRQSCVREIVQNRGIC